MSALRSLRKVGWVKIIAADADRLAAGLYLEGVQPLLVPKGNSSRYAKTLLKLCRRKRVNVILPCSDEEVWAISKHKQVFENAAVVVPIPTHEAVMRASDKLKCIEAARESGILTPTTFAPMTSHDAAGVLNRLKPPFVVRPRISRGARGVTYCDSRKEAEEAWMGIRRQFGSAMIQEFIPGGRGSVRVVLSLWDRDGTLRAAGVMRKLKERPETGGVAESGVTTKEPKILHMGISAVRAIGNWYGPAGAEIKVSSRNGKPYLMEVNPRLQGITHVFASAGLDFPVLWLKLALGRLRARKPLVRYTKKYFVRSWEDIALDRTFHG
jgi:carbamoyl-phosphate synthase large subunit